MSAPGISASPLRVAIIGSGPAGFYTVASLFKQEGLTTEIDMYEKLPTPFGLVRAGVAPDHQKDKTVTRVYEKSASTASFRFFGNVEFGRHVSFEDIRRHYHQVVFATGAQSERVLGIPGEDAAGSHPATDFVAWYNGHPDFAGHRFDLSGRSAAVVGLGNVAIDVARILCKSAAELGRTDIADHALEALRASRVKSVYLLGRRGPAQAAFTPAEIQELGALPDVDVFVRPEEARLDAVSRAAMSASPDRNAARNAEIIREFSERRPAGRAKRLIIRFLVSPTEIVTDASGKVAGVRIVKNRLLPGPEGSVHCRPTGEHEVLPVQVVFRSVGYRGLAVPGVPFDAERGVIPNTRGRVIDDVGRPIAGVYVVGWIKRGPSGVIGSNKTDAKETVAAMVEDVAGGRSLNPEEPGVNAATALVRSRQPRVVTYEHWRALDRIEVAKGLAAERPRVKFTDVAEMLRVLER